MDNENAYEKRLKAMMLWRAGYSVKEIPQIIGHGKDWFYYWVERYERYDPDDPINSLRNRLSAPKHQSRKTMPLIETMIVNSRKDRMARNSDSTKYALIGAKAIHYELSALGVENLPSARATHKILVRNHLIEKNRPNLIPIREPHCKHYPWPEANYINDLQQLDLIGPRYIENDSTKYYTVTLKDTVSKRINLEPFIGHQAQDISRFLISSWKTMGLPKVLQMDNGLEFRGSNRYPRRFGQVVRLCLDLGVIPVYIPPAEMA